MTKKDEKQNIKIAILETEFKQLTQDITKIKDNHLPHIYDRLGDIEKKIAYYIGGGVAILTMVQLAIAVFK